jgi:hypothetical protein
MSFGKALYFPNIHFQNENWLKYSLLYWDGIKRIVPPSYTPKDSIGVKRLIDGGLIESVDPKSGENPYTESAAKEFIPTVQYLLAKRGNLGRGSLVSNSLEKNAPSASVYIQKMDSKVVKLMTESGLAQNAGDWFNMDSGLAGYYMLCLAAHISEKQNAPLLSDSFEMETGGTFFQHSRISQKFAQRNKEDTGFQLARMVLSVPRTVNLATVPMQEILKFHSKYEPERMKFRQAIEKMVTDVAKIEDKNAIKDFLDQQKKTIKNALKDQESTLDELGVGMTHSLLSVSIPSGLAAVAVATHFDPITTAIASGVGIAFSVISWMAKVRGERRKAIRGSDWHYLLRIDEHFKGKEIVREGQQWFQQFLYD